MTYGTLILALPLISACAGQSDLDDSNIDGVAQPLEVAVDTGEFEDALTLSFIKDAEDGESVVAVEPERYLGLWYEIATTPSMQQVRCAGTTAEYSLLDDGVIGVHNRCYLDSLNGPLNQIRGTAKPIDESFARLLVDLGVGFTAPYNVVELDGKPGTAAYEFAVVSSQRRTLWVLSRTPQMDPDLYDLLVERALDRGLPADELILTEQSELD